MMHNQHAPTEATDETDLTGDEALDSMDDPMDAEADVGRRPQLDSRPKTGADDVGQQDELSGDLN